MLNKSNHLTNKEYEIMKILWDSDRPLLISEILPKADNIADNSLHPMIKKLTKNGFIKVVGNVRVVKTTSRLYAPAISVDEYAAMQLENIFKTSNKKLNLGNMVAYFAKHHKNDDKVISELEDFIKKYKEENMTK